MASTSSKAQREPNIQTYASFNLPSLLRLAESLRGRPCDFDTIQRPRAGALNWVIFVRFDDGIEWVFRAPKFKGFPAVQRATAVQLLASEVATLRCIRAHTTLPVPEVFHYNASAENDIGIPYILMSKAAGRPLAARAWQTHDLPLPSPSYGPGTSHLPPATPRPLTDHEKEKIMRQLGGFACQLYCLRLPAAGSLLTPDEHSLPGSDEQSSPAAAVGPCLSPGFVLQNRDTLYDELPRGPFHNDTNYYQALVTALLRHAERLPMQHHLFLAPVPCPHDGYATYAAYRTATDWWNDVAALGGRVDTSTNRLHYGLVAYLLRDVVIPVLTGSDPTSSSCKEDSNGDGSAPGAPCNTTGSGFSLCHADLSIQNIFVDDDLSITGIIDWEFCTAVPPTQLLAAPGMPHPRDLVDEPALHEAYRAGFIAAYEDMVRQQSQSDSGRDDGKTDIPHSNDRSPLPVQYFPPPPTDLAWTIGRAVSHFLRLANLDALQDYHHLVALSILLCLRSDTEAKAGSGSNSVEKDEVESWLARMLAAQKETPEALALAEELAADDAPTSEVDKEEQAYFAAINAPERQATARKLAVCASIRPWQVIDKRLWHWIQRARQE